jgi:hypothetical protein
MRNSLYTAAFILAASILHMQAQTTIKTTKLSMADAHSRSDAPDENYGTSPIFAVRAENLGGDLVISRAYFRFDLSSIPSNATIDKATFNIYGDKNDGRVQAASNPDSILISRITASWDESTLTWNNAPAVTASMHSAVMQNSDDFPVYSFMVTDIVKYWKANPTENYGLRIALKSEQPNTLTYGATSENTNTNLHPALEITYTIPSGIQELKNNEFIVRTLGNGQYKISNTSGGRIDAYRLTSLQGQEIQSVAANCSADVNISLSRLPKGFYILEARTAELNGYQGAGQ